MNTYTNVKKTENPLYIIARIQKLLSEYKELGVTREKESKELNESLWVAKTNFKK